MIEYEKRALTEEEDKYSFRQSTQISGQCGLIGYLRADMDTDGNGFFSSWNDYREDLKTDEFKAELQEVIDSLREEGDILHSRSDLAKYCFSTPQSRMNTEQDFYGIRVDTERYAFLLRLNPSPGDYNVNCYCYRRDWLDRHMQQAQKGIRFINSHYKELFRIPDGDKVRILFSDGDRRDRTARYIDDYHVEVGDNLYHICEFAERMEASQAKVIPLRSSLPERCYVYVQTKNEVGLIQKAESGYYRTDMWIKGAEDGKQTVNELNEKLGVTKAQAEAMKAGSMFGWETPAADPKNYDADGMPIKPVHKDRGDAR